MPALADPRATRFPPAGALFAAALAATAGCASARPRVCPVTPPPRSLSTTLSAPARWTLEPEARVASVPLDTAGRGGIRAVVTGSDGRIFVVVGRRVEALDSAGRPLTLAAADPRNVVLANPRALGFLGDSLWIAESGMARFLVLGPDGALVDSIVPRIVGTPATHAYRPAEPRWLLAGGNLLGMASARPRRGGGEATRVPLVLVHRTGVTLDTLAWLPAADRTLLVPTLAGGLMRTTQPFSDDGLVTVDAEGREIVLVDRTVGGERAEFSVTALGPTGAHLFSGRYRYAPQPVTPTAAGDAVHAILARDSPPSPAGDTSGVAERIRRAMYLPAALPPVSDVLVGRDGSVWLRREDAPGDSVLWTVLDPDGRVGGELRLPKGLRILQADRSRVWAVERSAGADVLVRFGVRGVGTGRDVASSDPARGARASVLPPPGASRVLEAVRLAQPPLLDGRLNERAWSYPPPFTAFGSKRPAAAAPPLTEVHVAYDDTLLYLGAELYARSRGAAAGAAPADGGERLTITLVPPGGERRAVRLSLDPSGGRTAERLRPGHAWRGAWRSAVHRADTGWFAEVALPFSELGWTPDRPGTWRLQVERHATNPPLDLAAAPGANGPGGFVQVVGLGGRDQCVAR